ncbi:AGC/PDK1 protein kinase [Aphelenchoides avenae]|nr:AGC/PDK1 protein kinase [Aphelenchus avenae]
MGSADATIHEEQPSGSSTPVSSSEERQEPASGRTESMSEKRMRAMDAFKVVKQRSAQPMVANRTPRDFFFIRVLGEGSFSTVYFAKEVDTGDEYAIKVLLKNAIRRENKVQYVLREKDIMAALTYGFGGHPFIVKLYCTFQDPERLYFALTYAKHGELLDLLRRLGSFDETVSLFYASEILAALEFLHGCGIIHRDLKPENILIGADWHVLVSDFGSAKIIGLEGDEPDINPSEAAERNVSRSSFVGTAQYISPEVLKSEPVGPECDYWALGAIIFQMISGQPPFRAVNEYHVLKKILALDYSFPDGFPEVAKDIVQKLLVISPSERLGSQETGGVQALKNHPYYKGVDWTDIHLRQPPQIKPYLPASCGEPAFYSDYPLPEGMEPGLNEAALTRLMGLSQFADVEFSLNELPSQIRSLSVRAKSVFDEELSDETIRQRRLDVQRRDNKFHRFVEDNLILKAGLIDKKKGLFARRRMFLLTEGPRLFYVDPINMELRGEIPFSAEMKTEAKNFRTFFVHTQKRTYYLFDPERRAMEWCNAIEEVRDRYFPPVPADQKTQSLKNESPKLKSVSAHPTTPDTGKNGTTQKQNGSSSGSSSRRSTGGATKPVKSAA